MLFVALTAILAEARPRYIAIPVEDLRLVRHARSLPGVPQLREAIAPGRMPVFYPDAADERLGEILLQDVSDSEQYQRQAEHLGDGYGTNDHVDYGAYTGGYGAFGWYTDHPVCINCGHGGYH